MHKLTCYDQYLDMRKGTQRTRRDWKERSRFCKKLWKEFFSWSFKNTKSRRRQSLKQIDITSTDEEIDVILTRAEWTKPKKVYLD